MEVKNNKILFNSRDWITIAPLISNNVNIKQVDIIYERNSDFFIS